MEEEIRSIVFSKNTIEFVTVAVQYCAFIEETADETPVSELTDKLTKFLPLIYLKATMLPETDMLDESEPEITVTEDDYNAIAGKFFQAFGKDDTYLEVFMEDMKYSETPISASISEDLTDIYQDLKNFITIFERGIVEHMNDALYICSVNFKDYWGQKLVNVLRALHTLNYSQNDEISEEEYNTENLW